MKAAFMMEPNLLKIKDIENKEPSDDEVQIKIKHVGLCGSDLHYFKNGRLGDNVVKEPHILGHEASGIITSVGSKITDFSEGDNVVIEPGLPCFTCNHCRKGHYNLCDNVVFMSVPGYHGALREYVNYSSHGIFKLPATVSLQEAALIEPLAVGYNAAVTAGIQPGSNVCITGAGPIGLTILEAVKIMGASKIMITDTDSHRLKIAELHGVDEAVNVITQNSVNKGMELTDGLGFDFLIDATGVPSAMESCIELAAKAARVVLVGLGESNMELSGYRMVKKQLTILGVNRYANHFQPVISLLSAGKYNLDSFISHEFSFTDIHKAFDLACNPEEKKMKVMLNF